MTIDYPHSFTSDEARARLEALGDYLQNKHGINVSWEGQRAAFKGKYLVVKFSGELSIGDGQVHFRGEDPGLLWRKRAVKYLRGKLDRYLDPKTAVGDLPRGE